MDDDKIKTFLIIVAIVLTLILAGPLVWRLIVGMFKQFFGG